jgi:hypothetical protein
VDSDIDDYDAFLVKKNDVGRSGVERLKNDRTIVMYNNIDDVRIPNQYTVERPLKRERRSGPERKSNRLIRSPARGNRGQEHAQRKGETARTKSYGHRKTPPSVQASKAFLRAPSLLDGATRAVEMRCIRRCISQVNGQLVSD